MATDLQTPPESSIVGALKGVLDDFQKLLQQQLTLFRAEVRADWHKTKSAVWPLVVGIGFLVIGAPVLCFMLAHLLHWLTSPAGADPARLPLWACFGLVGGALAVVGAVLLAVGIRKFQSFNPLPDESARALEENVRWLTNGK